MTRSPNRLAGWQRLLLYASGGVLLATGGLWLALHYSVGGGTGALPHPLESWAMRAHGLAGFAALFTLGALAASHVPHGWRISGRLRWASQRRSGLLLGLLGGLLALSGYLLYYFATEAIRPALGWAHAGAGVGMALLVASHRRRVS